jgi:tRNA pseudouridine38-40 synthase
VPTYRIDLAYDGTGFHGYARQHGLRTVQGSLETALFYSTGEVRTSVAGRTDRGVHAAGQVVSFEVEERLDTARLQRSLNRQLAPEIAVNRISEAAAGFHARFSAVARRYRYRVWNAPVHDPLLARSVWHVPDLLDAGAMDAAVRLLIGAHDFATFCRKAPGRTTEREVTGARWERNGDLLELSVVAKAFCHHMVRSIVATAVEIGRDGRDPDSMREALEARDRAASEGTAPPQGLTLMEVTYPDDTQGSLRPM